MNYYAPRQMKNADGSGGSWHYTNMNDGRIWPTGYCGQGCPGHPTADEACEHQKQYDIDNAIYDRFFHSDSATSRHEYKCQVPGCETWTKRFVRIPPGNYDYDLCEEHCNPEGLAQVHKVGLVTSSF